MAVLDLELVPALTRAVDDGSLQLHFQPEIDLASGSVVGMEALLRWAHPQRGLMWPADFLGVARATGLLDRIGRWVLQQGAAEAASWALLPPVPGVLQRQLRLNVSAGQLASPEFVADVLAVVSQHELAAGVLGLEFRQATLTRLAVSAPRQLAAVREAGVALAVDDVRAWRTVIAQTGELPIDIVKLPRDAVRALGREAAGRIDGAADAGLPDGVAQLPTEPYRDGSAPGPVWRSVEASVALAHERDLLVVAEGVESWTESAALCEIECDRAHGFLFSGPQRADRARAMLATGTGWQRPA
jgi:EAL domain-containing protein (putative c-di-GMP-specific phosphodiesterase class I)